MLKYIILFLFVISSSQLKAQDVIGMTTPIIANEAFMNFIKKDKFGVDEKLKYPGIKDKELKTKLTVGVNKIAKDFMEVSRQEIPTDVKYQRKIMFGLSSFNGVKSRLSTKDRQRVCQYIIELMDIIQLKSSKGQLMVFAYGFDAATIEKIKKAETEKAK